MMGRRFSPRARGLLLLVAGFVLPAAGFAASADIAAGDALFALRTSTSGAAEALASYEKAFGTTDEGEARWKAARALHWLGDQSLDRKTKIAFFEKGMDDAKVAIAALPQRPEPHFWMAALQGSYGEARGVLKSLFLVKPMREQLEAINRIDERYQGGAADRVLGIIDYKVPGFAGGSKKRAMERLNHALAIDANNAYNQYYLAEALADVGRKDEARAHLATLANLGVTRDVDGPDLESVKKKGEALAKKIGR